MRDVELRGVAALRSGRERITTNKGPFRGDAPDQAGGASGGHATASIGASLLVFGHTRIESNPSPGVLFERSLDPTQHHRWPRCLPRTQRRFWHRGRTKRAFASSSGASAGPRTWRRRDPLSGSWRGASARTCRSIFSSSRCCESPKRPTGPRAARRWRPSSGGWALPNAMSFASSSDPTRVSAASIGSLVTRRPEGGEAARPRDPTRPN